MLKCRNCKRFKAATLFSKRTGTKTGHRSECKKCRSNAGAVYYRKPERMAHVKAYVASHRNQRRNNTLRYMYGLSLAQYNELALAQNNLCAICNQPEIKTNAELLCVDHDHRTGVIRGLLCHKCNSAIGKLNDDPELLRKAIAYLERK